MKTLSDERRFTDIFIAIPENNAIKTVQHFPVFRALQECISCIVFWDYKRKMLPFNIDDLSITAKGLSKKAKANLEDWIAHTIILPIVYDKYFTKHQELLHLLAESPIVESVQALTYKTVKIHFSEALNDEHSRQLQGFILAQAGIYSYIGTSTVSDRNAYQALEWAKLDVNGRSHNDHKPAIFHRSKGLLGGFFHHGNQESIA